MLKRDVCTFHNGCYNYKLDVHVLVMAFTAHVYLRDIPICPCRMSDNVITHRAHTTVYIYSIKEPDS